MDGLRSNKKCPDKIYLQVCDECYEEIMKNAPDEITWCADQMDHANELHNGDGHANVYDEESDTFSDLPLDMAYIREDIYTNLLRRIKEAVEEMIEIELQSAEGKVSMAKAIGVCNAISILFRCVPEAKEDK